MAKANTYPFLSASNIYIEAQDGSFGRTSLASVNGGAVPPAGAIGDYIPATGASVAASSTAFSNSGGVSFTATDVGKVIVIDGAGSGGAALVTTIDAVNGANATLHAAASATVPSSYVSGASVVTAQSSSGSYAPTDTITLSGGTSAITGILTVATTQVVGATVAAGGSSGTNGTQTVYGTTGTGTKFQASVTVSGGAITAVGSISLAGIYSANPTDITQEPVTGAGLTGGKLALTMGVLSASVSTPGNYSVVPSNPVSQASTSGSGTGATFNLSFTASGAWAYATDDTAAISAAASASSPILLPKGKSYYTTTAITSFNLRTVGEGSLRDSSRVAQSPNFVGQTAAPSSLKGAGYIGTAFSGDISRVSQPFGKIISGSTTLGQPSSGYSINAENSIGFDYLHNASGYNSSTGGNGGRTGVAARYIKVDNYGQGDAMGLYINAFVSGAKVGATSFLANPAGGLLGGQVQPGADGVYLNPIEFSLPDLGRDVAAICYVGNISRTNDVGALGAVQMGFRSQSKGSAAIDAHFSGSGKAKIGLDLTSLTSNASGTWTNAAVTMLGNDRIYFNATAGASPGYAASTGNTYLLYASGNSGLQAVVGGSPAFLFTSSLGFLYASTITLGQNSNNKLQVAGAASGSSPAISVTASSDTNQDLDVKGLGTGQVRVAGALLRQGVGTSRVPVANGDLTLEFTSNTSITVRGKGSDGTTRTTTLTLA